MCLAIFSWFRGNLRAEYSLSMKSILYPILYLLVFPAFAQSNSSLSTPYERSKGKETATYAEVIDFYQRLDRQFDQAKLVIVGKTDVGKPLHLLLLSADKQFTSRPDRVTLLINNGIHPGEPEGIDACMMMARDLLLANKLPKHVLLAIVPVLNVGGSLNRGESRVNQNGPATYGFRGNARNLNLNRDFIKAEAENTRSFQVLFQQLKPHILIDNHTSNGADYQHVVTYFATQKDKLHPALSGYMTQTFQPELDRRLTDGGFPPAPYVNHPNETPESGLLGYNDSPRYSTGYAALFNCFGFTLETHMWKDYPARVKGSYAFDEAVMRLAERDARTIIANKQRADAAVSRQTAFDLNYRLDRSRTDSITFLGYEAIHKPSEVSGLNRLYYDRTKPFTKRIAYQNNFVSDLRINAPGGYVIPQGWREVIALLKRNGVQMRALARDTVLTVTAYYVEDYKTGARPYEGHYIHSSVQIRPEEQRLPFYTGDYVILTNQPANRYLIETLEPQAMDSFFAWNFFDSVLDQKEYFASYIFEDTAAELLRKDPVLRQKLTEKRAADKAFAGNATAQLEFIYQQTPYFEKTFNRYPVYRLENKR